MDDVEDNKDHTNQTGSKGPVTNDLFKHAYFRIAVLIARHDDGLIVKQDDDGARLRTGCGNCKNQEEASPPPRWPIPQDRIEN